MKTNARNTVKSNAEMIEAGIVKAGEFSYAKKPRTIKAYGQEYELPVKTIDFSDKLAAAADAIVKNSGGGAKEVVKNIKSGIALFIGEEEAERIFPEKNFGEIDIDEILGFFMALNFEMNRSQNDLIARYSASRAIRI